MKKNLNKLATLALTGILMTGMSFGALAASDAYEQDEFLTKQVLTDGKTFAPNTTFEFELSAVGNLTNLTSFKGRLSGSDVTLDSKYLKTTTEDQKARVTLSSVTFAALDTNAPSATYEKKSKLTIDENTFTEPGIYVFGVKEKTNDYEGVKCDGTQYYLLVSVINKENAEGTYEVKNAVLAAADGGKITEIKNHYGDETNNNDVNDLILKKTLSGAAVNHSDSFTFEVTVSQTKTTGATKEDDTVVPELYSYEKLNANGQVAEDAGGFLTAGQKANIVLAENESIHIYGLSKGDEVKIVEQAASGSDKGYKATYTTSGVQGAGATDAELTESGASVKADQDDASVTVTNTKQEITVTGVVMNIAPYAAMILGAGAFAGVFLGRKKSEDEE